MTGPRGQTVIAVGTSRMLNGTAFKRVPKAIEHLYYLVLFSTGPDYAGGDAGWRSWLAEGTNLGVKAAPHAVTAEDTYRFAIHSGARDVTVTATGNPSALAAVAAIAVALDRLRPATAGKPSSDKAAAVLADPAISELVGGPVNANLNKGSLEPDQAEHIRSVLTDSFEWLSSDQIVAITVQAEPVTAS
jgi:hypothetical protein